ncbi:MAG: ABC transporter substrate-binding protein [Clostridiales bacterium]|nr:ABC transporter substrate-binding protein [Clostridiales bacterium]
MKRKIIFILLTGLSLLTACQKQDTLVVGIVGKFSGANSDLGIAMYNATSLALSELNKSGRHYEKMYFDISNYETPESLFQDILSNDLDCIIGPDTSSYMEKIYPLVIENEILTFGTTLSADNLSNKSDVFFRLMNTTEEMAMLTVSFGIDGLNLKNTLFLYDTSNEAFTKQYVDYFTQYSKDFISAAGFIPLDMDSFGDLSEILLLYENYDSILLITDPIKTGITIQKIKRISPQIPILLSAWSNSSITLEYIGNNTENIYVISNFTPTKKDSYEIFKQNYFNRYETYPTVASYFGYEMTYFMDFTYQNTHFSDIPQTIDFIDSLDNYSGIFSDYTFNGYGDGRHPLVIQKIEDGQFVEVIQID